MLLRNVTIVNTAEPVNILVAEKQIKSISNISAAAAINKTELLFTGAIAFPGLINSHDHLDFNCFSPFEKKIYTDYTEWGNSIHTNYKASIQAVLKIPQQLRTAWGIYKNLLAGITTVVNHGSSLSIPAPLITVYQKSQSLHSVQFEQRWKRKLNNPFLRGKACIIHVGEGAPAVAAREIDELLKWNLLRRKLVGVHGVAMNVRQAEKFEALVWCPESNRVLLNRQPAIQQVKTATRIVFGTDSTLTGSWNIWVHLRLARSLKMLTDGELFSSVSCSPATLWKLNNGDLQPGTDADIVIAKNSSADAGWNDFYALNPENILLVIHKGEIRLFDETLSAQLTSAAIDRGRFHPISINGCIKWVEGDLPALALAIRAHHPGIAFPFEITAIRKASKNH